MTTNNGSKVRITWYKNDNNILLLYCKKIYFIIASYEKNRVYFKNAYKKSFLQRKGHKKIA